MNECKCYRTIFLLPFYMALCFTFLACDDCSDTIDAAVTPPVRFLIVDTMGGNLVDIIQSYYMLDSIRLFDPNEKEWIHLFHQYLPTEGGYVFSANFRQNNNGKSSLILQLNNLDSDTLDIWYKRKNNKCFTVHEYTHFQHNGRDIQKSPLHSALVITKTN